MLVDTMSALHEPMCKRPLSVSEYHLMGEVGILSPEERVELIEGEIISMPPIGGKHSGFVDHLNRLLVRAVGDNAIVRVQNPVVLSELSEPEPDLALLKPRNDFYKQSTPIAGDVLLLIEVSDTTLRYDQEVKARLYAKSGIPEFWIIDIHKAQLCIYRDGTDQGYSTLIRPVELSQCAPLALADASIDMSVLF